ncbi:GNAT family N-acetyltransferase [Candidatus Jorgensenbacteria bacterium]|nr:GNAT family N-acetyltransferase [Candidatus Jorgensenbacteria bacterium]
MDIRKFELDDINKGFLETLENLAPVGEPTRERSRKVFGAVLTNPVYNIFVAEIDGKIVGTITLLIEHKFIHGGGKVGHIEDVATRKGWEGRGIGRKLVERAIEEARFEECYKVILDCSEDNVPFYEKCGARKHEISMRWDLI